MPCLVGLAPVVVSFLVATMAGCSQSGEIVGDVYVAMASGDVRRAADVEIVLIHSTPELQYKWGALKEEFVLAYQAAIREMQETNETISELARRLEKSRGEQQIAAMKREAAARRVGSLQGIQEIERWRDERRGLIEEEQSAAEEAFRLERDLALMAARLRAGVSEFASGPGQVIEEYSRRADQMILQAATASTRTDVAGRYRLRSIEPGGYHLYAQFPLQGRAVRWFVPLEVPRGATIRMDLTTNNSWPFQSVR